MLMRITSLARPLAALLPGLLITPAAPLTCADGLIAWEYQISCRATRLTPTPAFCPGISGDKYHFRWPAVPPSEPADLPGGGNVGRGAGGGIFTVARLTGLIGLTLSREAG